ncbi:MAG: DUF1018 domain-containing protein, partial [Alphaproteobacteria bacterium]|nr:DUF1018 domain-containing protein [Alphaproteobacteria bacterium]
GEVHDSGEEALLAFVRRMTGIDSLAWLIPQRANTVIEALKSWLARAEAKRQSRPAEISQTCLLGCQPKRDRN